MRYCHSKPMYDFAERWYNVLLGRAVARRQKKKNKKCLDREENCRLRVPSDRPKRHVPADEIGRVQDETVVRSIDDTIPREKKSSDAIEK